MKRRSEAEWRALFAEHESSGMTATAFCRERGLCPKYFGLRRKQLLGKESDSSARSFVPVAVTGRNEAMVVELHLGEALQLRVPTSVSPRWLAELVQHLRA